MPEKMKLEDMTLKDLEANIIVEYDFGHKTIPMRLIYPEVIKEWAIAKVKENRRTRIRCISHNGDPFTLDIIKGWIMHNFNLMKEDLK